MKRLLLGLVLGAVGFAWWQQSAGETTDGTVAVSEVSATVCEAARNVFEDHTTPGFQEGVGEVLSEMADLGRAIGADRIPAAAADLLREIEEVAASTPNVLDDRLVEILNAGTDAAEVVVVTLKERC